MDDFEPTIFMDESEYLDSELDDDTLRVIQAEFGPLAKDRWLTKWDDTG